MLKLIYLRLMQTLNTSSLVVEEAHNKNRPDQSRVGKN